MQLKIQRTQRLGGLVGNTVLFCLDVRADYLPHEAANIAKYKLGREIIYSSRAAQRHLENAGAHLDRTQAGSVGERATGLARGVASFALSKMNLNISIGSLGRGHHIECKDLNELMEAEEAVMGACRNVRDYLKLAASFNGSTILVDFSEKDEQVHTAMGGEVYASLPASASAGASAAIDAEFEETPAANVPPGFASTASGPTANDQSPFGNMEETFFSLREKALELYAARPGVVLASGAALSFGVLLFWGFSVFLVLLALAIVAGAFIFVFARQR